MALTTQAELAALVEAATVAEVIALAELKAGMTPAQILATETGHALLMLAYNHNLMIEMAKRGLIDTAAAAEFTARQPQG